MSWTNGKAQIATETDLSARWGGGKPGQFFRCGLCGHRFKLGNYWRWVYTNSTPGASGNPAVCWDCDGPDVIDKWKTMHEEAKGRFWWFTRPNEP